MTRLDREVYAARARTTREFILRHTTERGYPPSRREIADELGISLSTAHDHLNRMVRDGLLITVPGIGRQIRVTETVLPESGEVL